MIRTARTATGEIEVTFALAHDDTRADVMSVVGDFNGWDPTADRFTRPATASEWQASVVLTPGRRYAFRYLTGDGHWFNDEAAPAYEDNGAGQTNAILDLPPLASIDAPPPPGRPPASADPPAELQPGGFNGGTADAEARPPPPHTVTSAQTPGWSSPRDTDEATRVGLRAGEQPDTLATDAGNGGGPQGRGGQAARGRARDGE